jgi:hypothetical protein
VWFNEAIAVFLEESRIMLDLRPFLGPLVFLLVTGGAAAGAELAQPQAEVVLTVTGSIGNTNQGDTAVFDLEMLQALGADEFQTATIWTEGQQTFTGVPLATLLDALAAEGSILEASAINDYSVKIPISDAVEGGPLIAYLRNGQTMTVRDKGPLWIVYPYDARPEYRQELIYSRSIWQLNHIEVQP